MRPKLKRTYLRRAAVYRRFAGRDSGMDFSADALLGCYRYESSGGAKPARNNGYVFGKWAMDVTIATWREDIRAGLFCKAEFITPLSKWYAVPALSTVISPAWFPFDRRENHVAIAGAHPNS